MVHSRKTYQPGHSGCSSNWRKILSIGSPWTLDTYIRDRRIFIVQASVRFDKEVDVRICSGAVTYYSFEYLILANYSNKNIRSWLCVVQEGRSKIDGTAYHQQRCGWIVVVVPTELENSSSLQELSPKHLNQRKFSPSWPRRNFELRWQLHCPAVLVTNKPAPRLESRRSSS